MNIAMQIYWEIYEKTEANVKKWPFRIPRTDQILL